MSENLDIGALRSIASAAPRGSWSVWTSNSWRRVFSDQRGKHVTVIEPTKQPDGHVDLLFGAGVATFLETFTADTVLQLLDEVAMARVAAPAPALQARDDTGRLTSDYEPTAHEIKVCRDAICREFGGNGTDGYYIRILKAIHGSTPPDAALDRVERPIPWKDVIRAIRAVDVESARRGEMWPQTRDEQREDRRAMDRVCETIRFYATSAGARVEMFDGWPSAIAATTPTAPTPVTCNCSGLGPCERRTDGSCRLAAPPTRPDGDALSPEERELFERTVDQFGDCNETDTDYAVLMDWARRGLLECTHFEVTAKGNGALAFTPTPQGKEPT